MLYEKFLNCKTIKFSKYIKIKNINNYKIMYKSIKIKLHQFMNHHYFSNFYYKVSCFTPPIYYEYTNGEELYTKG